MIAQNCFGKLEPRIGKYFIQKSNNKSKNNKRLDNIWPLIYFALSLIFLFSDILKMNIKNEFYESSNNYEKGRMNYEKNKLHKRKDVIRCRLVAERDYYVDNS